MSRIRAVLIDLSGTLHIDNEPTVNAVKALARYVRFCCFSFCVYNKPPLSHTPIHTQNSLRTRSDIHIRFVTNTTKESAATLYNRLKTIGFQLTQSDIFSSLTAAAKYVNQMQLTPLYLLTEDARRDFPPAQQSDKQNAIVIGLAPEHFNYARLNEAFQLLMEQKGQCPLIAIHAAKYYKPGGGSNIALGPGCFVRGLEYSSGCEAIVLGKPNAMFFDSVRPDGVAANNCVMIGDVSIIFGSPPPTHLYFVLFFVVCSRIHLTMFTVPCNVICMEFW